MSDAPGVETGHDATVHRFRHDGPGSMTAAVAQAVAELEGVDPLSLEPLYSAVDPDLLEALDGRGRPLSADAVFDYLGYRISVDSEGGITVVPREEADTPGDCNRP